MAEKLIINKGDRYNMLTIIEEIDKDKNGQRRFLCQCDCGNTSTPYLLSLRNKTKPIKSCGCETKRVASQMCIDRNTTHGMPQDKYYSLWVNIKARCYNDKSPKYKYYGARGIKMQESWLNDYSKFHNYVTSLKDFDVKDFSLDRIDNDANYIEGNLRWVDQSTQRLNSRGTLHCEIPENCVFKRKDSPYFYYKVIFKNMNFTGTGFLTAEEAEKYVKIIKKTILEN